jgi:glycosyltransferase involved in cell wall biosynthesis
LPGRNHENRYFRLLSDSLGDEGLKVLNIRDPEAWVFKFDIFHIHFPTHFVTQSNSFGAVFWAFSFIAIFLTVKALGKRIVYTIHDVVPINIRRGWLLWPYLRLVHELCDGYVFLNKSSQLDFYARFSGQRSKPSILVPHGPYPADVSGPQARLQKRRDLIGESDALLVGFVGNIKPYKNLGALTSLPSRLSDGRRVCVVVAGQVERGYEKEALETLRAIPPAHLLRIDKGLSDKELDDLIQAVDVVMLPYSIAWSSGAAMLVLSNRGRMVGSDLAVFTELESSPGHPWAYTFCPRPGETSASLAAVIEKIALNAATRADEEVLARFLTDRSWSRAAEDIKIFYESLLRGAEQDARMLSAS